MAIPAANQKNTSTKGLPTNHHHKSCWRWKISLSKMVISTGVELHYPMPRTLEEYYSLWQACICSFQLLKKRCHYGNRTHMLSESHGSFVDAYWPDDQLFKVYCFHERCKTFLTGSVILPWTNSHESLELEYVFMKSSLLL